MSDPGATYRGPDRPSDGNGTHEPAVLFDPPNSFLAKAILRHKLIIVVVAVLGAAIGLAVGLHRTPTYSAAASLQVGQVNPNSPGFLGYTQSASSLATVFSQAIAAEPVLRQIQKEIGVEPPAAASRLSSEPLPLSPTFRVIATGSSEEGALRLANSAAKSVENYVNKSNSANPEADALLGDYRSAAKNLHEANAKLSALESAGGRPASKPVIEAAAAQSAAKLKAEAVGRSYIETVSTQAPRQGLVTLVAGATSAEDDHRSKAQLYAFMGLLAGIVAGAVVAGLIERRSLRKTAAAAA